MFSLSSTARHNLEAILHEFQRASLQHGPLFHERFHAWRDGQEDSVTDRGWLLFIEDEGRHLSDDGWHDWEFGFNVPGWSYSSLARWFGDSTGRVVLNRLIDAVLDVLEREDLSAIPEHIIPFNFGSVEGWIGTLHSWAFRIQMPLLKCSMAPWNTAEDVDELEEVTREWIKTKDKMCYPKHPLRFTLEHDLFTSSMAAISSLIWPDLVVGINEPWPLRATENRKVPEAETERKAKLEAGSAQDASAPEEIVHVISRTQIGWEVFLFDQGCRIQLKNEAGLHRIAMLIRDYPKEWCPIDLAQYGARSIRKVGKVSSTTPLDYDSGLNLMSNKRRDKADPQTARIKSDILEEIKEWQATKEQAKAEGNSLQEKEATEELQKLFKYYEDNQEKTPESKAKDSIRSSIGKTFREMRDHVKGKENIRELLAVIDQLETQIDLSGPRVRYVPKKDTIPWTVRD